MPCHAKANCDLILALRPGPAALWKRAIKCQLIKLYNNWVPLFSSDPAASSRYFLISAVPAPTSDAIRPFKCYNPIPECDRDHISHKWAANGRQEWALTSPLTR